MEPLLPWKHIAGVAIALGFSEFLELMAKSMPETVFGWFLGASYVGVFSLLALALYLGQLKISIRKIAGCFGCLALFNCLAVAAAKLLIRQLLSSETILPIRIVPLSLLSVVLFGLAMTISWYVRRCFVQLERNFSDSPNVIHFYAASLPRRGFLWVFGVYLIIACLLYSLGVRQELPQLGFLMLSMIWFQTLGSQMMPMVSISRKGMCLLTTFGGIKFYEWSRLKGKARLQKTLNGYMLIIEQADLSSEVSLLTSVAALSKEDQEKVVDALEKHLGSHEEDLDHTEVQCFECGTIIPTDLDACPRCGWTWK